MGVSDLMQEFDLGSVDMPQPMAPQGQQQPNAPPPDISQPTDPSMLQGLSQQGQPQLSPGRAFLNTLGGPGFQAANKRPTFLSAFLANLGPALAGGLSTDPKNGALGSLGGAMGGIQKQKNTEVNQGIAQENSDTKGIQAWAQSLLDQQKQAKIQQDSELVPVPDGKGGVQWAPRAQAPKFFGMQSAQDIAARGNASRETIAAGNNQTSRDNTTANNAQKQKGLDQQYNEFQQTDAFKRWHDTNLNAVKKDIATIQANASHDKAPEAMMQSATFAIGAKKTITDAMNGLQQLESQGKLGSVAQDKLENYLFSKGLADPSWDAETQRQMGSLRMALTGSVGAFLRAHTGRSAGAMYEDISKDFSAGQGLPALYGTLNEASGLMDLYANAPTDANIAAMRAGTAPGQAGGPAVASSKTAPSTPGMGNGKAKGAGAIKITRDANGRIIGIE